MRNKRARKGFTILEFVIYILIFGIVSTLGAAVFNFATKAKIYAGELSEVQVNATRALSEIVGAVHSASGINGASSTLSLAMSSSTLNPTIFSLSGGAILEKQGSGAAASTTPSTITISALTFTLLSNPSPSTFSVQITLTAEYNKNGTPDVNSAYTLRTTAMPL